MIGAELGGYRLEALIGRGGMSAVYRAEDLRLGRTVALKFLAAELAADERFRERFLAESRLAASIDHPGIVPIYEAGEAEGLLYIAMRYVEGTDLQALLRREAPLASVRAVALVAQVADALDAAHARGLIHRDVKPGNVLVADRDEHVYLADFGLTRHTSSRDGRGPGEGLVGTVDYVAPEQIRGEAVDGRADLYSLGCVLYECLTGSCPSFAAPRWPSSTRTSRTSRHGRASAAAASRDRLTRSSGERSPRIRRSAGRRAQSSTAAVPRIAAVMLAVAIAACGSVPQPGHRPAGTAVNLQARLDATSDAEARIMRHATSRLAAELHNAARCDVRGSEACLLPALQHAGIGGRTSAMLLRGVVARVPAGACREYLFGLGAANEAAGDQARWALSTLYGRESRRLARAAAQTAQVARMLDRASRAASADVCAPSAQGPPA